jgi:sigma-B regulation protein RsbU (phosphoserine phosphatase)
LADVDFARPSDVLSALNRALPMQQYGSMYVTLWYGVYGLANRQLVYASAGHPPGLLFSNQGRRRHDLATENPPVGVLEEVQFQQASLSLDVPCSLYLYSDGVFEITTKTGSWWSSAAFADYLQQQVQQGTAEPAGLFQAIRLLTRADRFDDDFSLLRLNFDA